MQELLVDIDDLDELYRCYMPYLKKGGLFVRTNMRYEVGHSLALRVSPRRAHKAQTRQGLVLAF